MTRFRKTFVIAALCLAAVHSASWAQTTTAETSTFSPTVGQSGKDVIWVPTPQALVDRMLEAARITPDDYLIDLGSGDGRTVITAAKRGTRAHGVEFNPDMVALSQRTARAEGVEDKATFEQGDIFETDFSKATVLTLFLLPDLNLKLRPTILNMKPGTRVVSNSFTMGDWQPDDTFEAQDGCTSYCTAYAWVVPAKVGGSWDLDGKQLVLNQSYQLIEGSVRDGDKAEPISNARLEGTQIAFTAGGQTYTGQVDGNTMKGTVQGKKAWNATRTGQ